MGLIAYLENFPTTLNFIYLFNRINHLIMASLKDLEEGDYEHGCLRCAKPQNSLHYA